MNVLISGMSGFLGSALARRLTSAGHRVRALSRRRNPEESWVTWNPAAGELDPGALTGVDAVVHLSGASVAGRWTRSRRREIRQSRVAGTSLLAQALAGLTAPPDVLVCASGVNIYGDGGASILTERSPGGTGFLADVCREWEAAAEPVRAAGIRLVHVRLGVVLGREGGALPQMLALFRLGLGGVLGSGRQYMSWITREDAAGVMERAIHDSNVAGPVNAVTPNPVTNREFTRTLARVLRRPALLPVPAIVLRVLLGQAADELLLASLRVQPEALLRAGHDFGAAELEPALRRLLS